MSFSISSSSSVCAYSMASYYSSCILTLLIFFSRSVFEQGSVHNYLAYSDILRTANHPEGDVDEGGLQFQGACCRMHLNSLWHWSQNKKQRTRWQQCSASKGQYIWPMKHSADLQIEHLNIDQSLLFFLVQPNYCACVCVCECADAYELGQWCSQTGPPPKNDKSYAVGSGVKADWERKPRQTVSLMLCRSIVEYLFFILNYANICSY